MSVDQATDLPQATQHLLEGGATMIVIPTNNLIYENLSPVVELANKNQVPVVSMSKKTALWPHYTPTPTISDGKPPNSPRGFSGKTSIRAKPVSNTRATPISSSI